MTEQNKETETKQCNIPSVGSSTDKCTQCPECGDKEYLNKNLVGDGYRMCRSCHQDWWIDIDYKS